MACEARALSECGLKRASRRLLPVPPTGKDYFKFGRALNHSELVQAMSGIHLTGVLVRATVPNINGLQVSRDYHRGAERVLSLALLAKSAAQLLAAAPFLPHSRQKT